MAMHSRNCLLHNPQNIPVIKRREAMWKSALNANFGGAERPRRPGLLRDLFEAQEVGVVLARSSAERAELTTHEANVGEIDVPIDDVSHQIPGQFGTKCVGSYQHTKQIITLCRRQQAAFGSSEGAAIQGFKHSLQSASDGGCKE